MESHETEKELVVHPGDYAYVLDETKGQITVNTGPIKTTLGGNDAPVEFLGKNGFKKCSISQSIKRCPVAVEGWYIVLYHPSKSMDKKY